MLTMEEHYDVNSMDSVNNNNSSSSGLSKAELRKSNKPIMEKRRRARINNCLNELKSLILDAMKKPARHTKLEKADILEMTVKHLQTIQRQQLSIAMQTDPTVIHKFKSGFSECTEEINRYLNQLDGLDNGVRQRLSNHLNNCVTGLDHVSSFSNFTTGFRGTTNPFPGTLSSTPNRLFPLTEDVNNNGRLNVHGTQLIPSRLPTGEVALIVPNSNSFPLFSSNLQLPTLDIPSPMQRFSAFAKPSSTNLQSSTNRPSLSPPLSPISSVSSCGDESIMHTSSDFASKVSQWDLNQSMLSQASLSPDSSRCAVPVSNIQQSQISSTSETANTSRKRLYNEDKDNHEEVDALNGNPPAKVAKKDKVEGNENSTSRDGPSDMWRPW